jgi:hypothetical protein
MLIVQTAHPNSRRVGEPVKSSWAMPNAERGRPRILAFLTAWFKHD